MLWGGNRLIGSYWYLSMTGRHQTNVAGRALKQIEFETLQPGPAVPLPQCPHLHVQESCPFPGMNQPVTKDWESIYPAHVLSQEQPKPCAEWKPLSRHTCLSQHPPRLPEAGNRSLLSPGFAGPVGWAVILFGRSWLQGCGQVWAQKEILWRLCLLSVCWSSLLPYISPTSSPFCTHTAFPIYLACIFSYPF